MDITMVFLLQLHFIERKKKKMMMRRRRRTTTKMKRKMKRKMMMKTTRTTKRKKTKKKNRKKRKKWTSDESQDASPLPRPRLSSLEAHRQTQEAQNQLVGRKKARAPLPLLPLRLLQQYRSSQGRLQLREQRRHPTRLLWAVVVRNSETRPWLSCPSRPTLPLPRQLSVHAADPSCLSAVGRLSFRLQCQEVWYFPEVAVLPSLQVPLSAQSRRGFPSWGKRRLAEPECSYPFVRHPSQLPSGIWDKI